MNRTVCEQVLAVCLEVFSPINRDVLHCLQPNRGCSSYICMCDGQSSIQTLKTNTPSFFHPFGRIEDHKVLSTKIHNPRKIRTQPNKMSGYHPLPELESRRDDHITKQQSPLIIPLGSDDDATNTKTPQETSQLQTAALCAWMGLATAGCVPVALVGLAGLMMSPMMLDSGTPEAWIAFGWLLFLLIAIPSLLVSSVVGMWMAFLKHDNRRRAFWLGLPSVVVLVDIAYTILFD